MPDDADLVELARIWRGPVVESRHHGVIAVADTAGRLRHAWGDTGWQPTPRSALKPFAAIALVESGAADALGLGEEHIAMACASHHAQPFQVAIIGEWLGRLGLAETALVCGPALPRDQADMGRAFAEGGPRRLFHNCSGKHCGFLSVARHLGAGLDYASPDHPAQRLYRDVLAEFTGLDAERLPAGTDNCGLPAIAMPIATMATAIARFGAGEAATPARRAATRRVLAAMRRHPDHLAATDNALARLIRACGGNLVAKTGAEGYLVASLLDRGLGIAVKIADGDPAGRVKIGVMAQLLGDIGALPQEAAEALVAAVAPQILDSNDRVVGRAEILRLPV